MIEFKNALKDWLAGEDGYAFVSSDPLVLAEKCELKEQYVSPKNREVCVFYCDPDQQFFYVLKVDDGFKVTLLPPDQTWYFGKASDIDCCDADVWIANNPDGDLESEGPIGYLLALEGVLPEGFESNESSESLFEMDSGGYRAARKLLLKAGLIESRIKE